MPKILHNVRDGILLSGRDLLLESGYEKFSVRQVASHCGIGVGTLYNYFPSKQQLVTAILRSEWDIHMRRMALVSKSSLAAQAKLESIYDELCRFLQGVHSVWVGGIAESVECAEIKNVQQQRAAVRMQMAEIVAAALGQEGGTEQEAWLADCVTRLFISYAGSRTDSREAVSKALQKLLG
jgi:AcrR family transcriptional regulator